MQSSDAYRTGYRIEMHTRPLTPQEDSLVARHVAQWDDAVRRFELGKVKAQRFMALGLLSVAVLSFVSGKPKATPLALACAFGAIFFMLIAQLTRKRALEIMRVSRGPWHPPPSGWQVRETRVVARSMVRSVSGDEDYDNWLLFEIPGGEWFYLWPSSVPELTGDAFARADLRFLRLWPHGAFLGPIVSGETIPVRGASADSEAYADEVARGHVWAPPDEGDGEGDAEGLIAEEKLPEWIRGSR